MQGSITSLQASLERSEATIATLRVQLESAAQVKAKTEVTDEDVVTQEDANDTAEVNVPGDEQQSSSGGGQAELSNELEENLDKVPQSEQTSEELTGSDEPSGSDETKGDELDGEQQVGLNDGEVVEVVTNEVSEVQEEGLVNANDASSAQYEESSAAADMASPDVP